MAIAHIVCYYGLGESADYMYIQYKLFKRVKFCEQQKFCLPYAYNKRHGKEIYNTQFTHLITGKL